MATNYNTHGDRIASLSIKWMVLYKPKENDKKAYDAFFLLKCPTHRANEDAQFISIVFH
jgi:hypothetical protein